MWTSGKKKKNAVVFMFLDIMCDFIDEERRMRANKDSTHFKRYLQGLQVSLSEAEQQRLRTSLLQVL